MTLSLHVPIAGDQEELIIKDGMLIILTLLMLSSFTTLLYHFVHCLFKLFVYLMLHKSNSNISDVSDSAFPDPDLQSIQEQNEALCDYYTNLRKIVKAFSKTSRQSLSLEMKELRKEIARYNQVLSVWMKEVEVLEASCVQLESQVMNQLNRIKTQREENWRLIEMVQTLLEVARQNQSAKKVKEAELKEAEEEKKWSGWRDKVEDDQSSSLTESSLRPKINHNKILQESQRSTQGTPSATNQYLKVPSEKAEGKWHKDVGLKKEEPFTTPSPFPYLFKPQAGGRQISDQR